MSLDIHCPRCGEPWDMMELHDMYDADDKKVKYKDAVKLFVAGGCGAWDQGATCAAPMVDPDMADRARIMMELSCVPDEWLY